MKYDDSTWHTDGDFPADLPPEAGATHIGMFMVWALAQNLRSEHRADYRADVMAQRGTPGRLLLDHCDGQIIDEDLNDLGSGFAARYYDVDDNLYHKDSRRSSARGSTTWTTAGRPCGASSPS